MRIPVFRPGRASPDLPLSPAIRSGDHLFLTGMTGSLADGTMPLDPTAQFESAFDKIAGLLAEADLTLDAVSEVTTFHVDLNRHFETFEAVWRVRFAAPYPAWTAVGVAGLRRQGALVEIRAIAHIGAVPLAKNITGNR
ncbi:MAG: RidA family protein [Pseudomonadota bacterium]